MHDFRWSATPGLTRGGAAEVSIEPVSSYA
jgi:hypothetical protein